MYKTLFRGINESGQWVKGSLITTYDGQCFIQESRYYLDIAFDTHAFSATQVLSHTVGQYIGLEDKNGEMIFKGDRVTNQSGIEWIVIWDKDNARFALEYVDKGMGICSINSVWIIETGLEVIGKMTDKKEANNV